jgi:dTDP-4-dehydrorhamnose 3,5-epimerase-like enzyme
VEKNMGAPELRMIPTRIDNYGSLSIIEGDQVIPFEIKRIYYLHGVPVDATRGSHSHKELFQFMIPVSGSFRIKLETSTQSYEFELNDPSIGLYVPPGYWRTLTNFTEGSVCLVLASKEFDESDYIRDFDVFLSWSRNRD